MSFKVIVLLFMASPAFSLVPFESLILGDVRPFEKERKSDPINAIFKGPKEDNEKNTRRRSVANLRALMQQGIYLRDRCQIDHEITYSSNWEREQVKRSIAATFQFIGLDFSVKAIAHYARYFKFTKQEYENLVSDLINNKCSKNITVMSLKQIKRNLFAYFQENDLNGIYTGPSVQDNPYFPKKLSGIIAEDKWKEREFITTVKFFRDICSWGNRNEDYRLMSFYLRDPFLMSLIINQMSSKAFYWDSERNENYLVESEDTTKVACRDLLCRNQNTVDFNKYFKRSIGSISVKDDLERLYCTDLRNIDFKYRLLPPTLLKTAMSLSFEEMYLTISHAVALMTGTPNFFLRLNTYDQGERLARTNIEQIWDEWANEQNTKYSRSLYFEEPLTLEVVDRKHYFNSIEPKFRVELDVNLGEFDRISQKVGKITAGFNLKMSRAFLKWIRLAITGRDPRGNNLDKAKWRLERKVTDLLEVTHKKFIVKPWYGKLAPLITNEIIQQVGLYKGKYFLKDSNDVIDIPIKLNFAPFALKYFRYEYFHLPEKMTKKIQKRRGELIYR